MEELPEDGAIEGRAQTCAADGDAIAPIDERAHRARAEQDEPSADASGRPKRAEAITAGRAPRAVSRSVVAADKSDDTREAGDAADNPGNPDNETSPDNTTSGIDAAADEVTASSSDDTAGQGVDPDDEGGTGIPSQPAIRAAPASSTRPDIPSPRSQLPKRPTRQPAHQPRANARSSTARVEHGDRNPAAASTREAESRNDDVGSTRFPLWITAVTVAAVATFAVFLIGLLKFFPAGRIDVLDRADHTTGELQLEFRNVPKGFEVKTSVAIYDRSYKYASGYSDPIHSSFVTKVSQEGQSDLQEVFIRADLVAPKRGKAGPAPVTWDINSSGSAKLAYLADIHDNGKLRSTSCSFSTIDGRVPDNAVKVNSHGPDPYKLSYAYLNSHHPADLQTALLGASADKATIDNTGIRGDATTYAGVICPGAVQRTPDPNVPDCKPSQVIPAVTVDPNDAAKARARALGTKPSVTTFGFCPPVITNIEVGGSTPLFFGSIFDKPQTINSSSGEFAVHLPRISVVGYDAAGHGNAYPVTISLYPSTLLSDTSISKELAPPEPVVDRARYRWIDEAKPTPAVWCSQDSQCPNGRVLIWEQKAVPLDLELTGKNIPEAHAAAHEENVGLVEWTVAATVLVPLLATEVTLFRSRKRSRSPHPPQAGL